MLYSLAEPSLTAATAALTAPTLGMWSDGTEMPFVEGIIITSSSAPDDHTFSFQLVECSDDGTGGTAAQINKLRPGAASISTGLKTPWATTAPTQVANPERLVLDMNRRGRLQVQFAPECGIGISSLAAERGLMIVCTAVGTASVVFSHNLVVRT